MEEGRERRWTARLLGLVLGAAGAWIGVRWLLPLALPFLVGAAGAWLMEPAVTLLTGRLRLPRRWAAGLCTLGLAAGAAAGAGLVLWRLWYEALRLASGLPALLEEAEALLAWGEEWLTRALIALPPELREGLLQAAEGGEEALLALPGQVGGWLAGAAAGLPGAGLFLFAALLSAYYLSAGRPGLSAALDCLPPQRREKILGWLAAAGQALRGWLKAQGLLALTSFGLSALGLLVLGVEPALLAAGGIALVDALPVLGSGAVLLPWALVVLVLGNLPMGLGLLGLYAVLTITRSLLEPRLVGRQAGLPPLLALVSMYGGFRLLGVGGLILAPLGAMVAWQLWMGEQKRGAAQPPPPAGDKSMDTTA